MIEKFSVGTISRKDSYEIEMSSCVNDCVFIYNLILNTLCSMARDNDIKGCKNLLLICSLLSRQTQEKEKTLKKVSEKIVFDNLFK